MRNQLTGNLRTEFEMVLRMMEKKDRLLLQVRTERITTSNDEHMYGCVMNYRWAASGALHRCEMVFNPAAMRSLNLKKRLSVMAHEIGHVLTLKSDTGWNVGEFLADQYARDLGFGDVSGLRAYWADKRRPARWQGL